MLQIIFSIQTLEKRKMEVEENPQLQTRPESSPMEVEQIDRRPAALGDLRILPDEVLCAILTFLTPRDVARLSCVSRFFQFLYCFFCKKLSFVYF